MNNFIVTDGLVNKTRLSSVVGLTALGNNALFAMSNIGTVNFAALDTELWTLTTGNLPALKVLSE